MLLDMQTLMALVSVPRSQQQESMFSIADGNLSHSVYKAHINKIFPVAVLFLVRFLHDFLSLL